MPQAHRQEAREPALVLPMLVPPGRESGELVSGSVVSHVRRYQIVRCIGEGGMGRIYRAFDRVLERDIAIKAIKPDVAEAQKQRFRQEAVYGARFCHPSIARVYDMGTLASDGTLWFAMEYLPGRDLDQVLERARAKGRRVPPRLVSDVFRQALAALQYAHDCKVIHRDVKPANMFVTVDPNTRFVTTKLLDFGVALDLSDVQAVRQVCGDPYYMAPEQTRSGARLDIRADIYAAGMSLYEVITGKHPFEDRFDDDPAKLLVAQREHMPTPPSELLGSDFAPEVARGLDRVFARACAKDPEQRYASAREMYLSLKDVLAACGKR